MRCFQNAVPTAVDDGAFALCVAAPEHEHDTLTFAIDNFYDLVGKSLPTLALVGTGMGTFDGQNAIEEENALVSPGSQMPVIGDCEIQFVA